MIEGVPTPENPLFAAALRYATDLHLAVFPCYEIVRSPHGWDCACPPTHRSRDSRGRCGSPGKHPRTSKGCLDASRDQVTIKRWWMRWPKANIGIATGAASGIVVVDIDPRNGGDDALHELEQAHGPLPETPHQLTGGGGSHFLFLRPSLEYVAGRPVARGVDIKADGGYIIAAPSSHIAGTRYGWELTAMIGELAFAALPEWIAERCQKTRQLYGPTPLSVSDGYFGAAFDAAGWLLRPLGADKVAARCPWETEHTGGVEGDSSTVVFAPQPGSKRGWFHCSHEHCRHRTQTDVLATIPPAADQRARKQLKLSAEYDPAGDDAPTPSSTAADEWKTALQFTNGRYTRSPMNAALLLTHLPEWVGCLEYDEFVDVVRWVREPPPLSDATRPQVGDELRDHHVTYVQGWFAAHRNVDFGKTGTLDALLLAARATSVHPVRRYLDSLVWDGVGRLGTWLTRYFGAPDHDLVHKIGIRWMVSAVARVKRPGCQADHLLVLEGPQGAGKSQAVRTLAGEWYLGTLPDVRGKDAMHTLAGHWIVEIAELLAFKGASFVAVKNWTTQTVDVFRPAYGHHVVRRPRQVVFIATTNEAKYLSDATGNRRFWPIATGAIDLDGLATDRDQLWAEATLAYADGVRWWPDGDDESTALRALQETRVHEDVWEGIILPYLNARPTVTTAELLTDALQFALGACGRREQMRVVDILKRHGWVQIGRGANDVRRWRRASDEPTQQGLW